MKRNLIFIFLFSCFFSCKKTKVEIEETIVFETNAPSVVVNTSNSFDFQVIIKSKLPSKGLTLEVDAIDEALGNTIFQSAPLNMSTAVVKTLVQNLPQQKWVLVNVKIKSVMTPTNNASESFRIIYK